jgi:hypothetical protein
MEEEITITKREYESLKRSDARLTCLECGGVDNWSGFGECYNEECEGHIATMRREDC